MEGRNLTIKKKLDHFQLDMEMYFPSIKKKEVMIESYASMYLHNSIFYEICLHIFTKHPVSKQCDFVFRED